MAKSCVKVWLVWARHATTVLDFGEEKLMSQSYNGKDALNIFGTNYSVNDLTVLDTKFVKTNFEGTATDIYFENCEFDRCIMGINTRFFGVSFSRCDLFDVKFDTFFGANSKDRNTSFVACQIKQKKSKNCLFSADFAECDISGKFESYHFSGNMNHCKFSGEFSDTIIGAKTGEPNSVIANIDFSEVQKFDVRFERCNVVDCKFPKSDSFFAVHDYLSVLRQLIEISRVNNREYGIKTYSTMLSNASPTQNLGVISLEYVELFAGPSGTSDALNILRKHKIN
jgi:hypothetical protein